ncbi:MAG: DUF192 domain-containing protein [Pseudomonadota bacterium]
MRAFILVLLTIFTVATAHAEDQPRVEGQPFDIVYEAAPLTITVGDNRLQWRIELADEQPERSRGLMFRQSMKPMTGMLFRFDVERPVTMWMKNTFISLDMLFADASGTIIHIAERTEPQSLDIISSQGPASYVLEINGGEAERLGVTVGQRMVHPAIGR